MGFGSADKILSSSAPFYTASSENYLQTVLDFLVRHIQLVLAQRNPVAVQRSLLEQSHMRAEGSKQPD